ncbi:MAG: flagellar brake protein [Gammaproteobacteria bacterium]|nr:flagellar brake protein [Gammaproteobacteria bacterium]
MENQSRQDPFGAEENVTDPTRIVALLRGLMDSHALLSVSIPGEQSLYSSALLEVDPDLGHLLLDELNPRRGHERLLEARKLQVIGRLHGIEIRFPAAVQEIGGAAGIAYYQLAIPGLVRYRQRRTHYRVEVGASLVIPVQLALGPEQLLDGSLHDLSVSGVGAYLASGTLQRGDTVPACVVQLPDAPPLRSALEVCYVRFDEARGKLRIGGRFLDLTRAQQKCLERFVAELERRLLQRRRR